MKLPKSQSSVTSMGNKNNQRQQVWETRTTKDSRPAGGGSGQGYWKKEGTKKTNKCSNENRLPVCYRCQRRKWSLEDY